MNEMIFNNALLCIIFIAQTLRLPACQPSYCYDSIAELIHLLGAQFFNRRINDSAECNTGNNSSHCVNIIVIGQHFCP